REISGTGTGPIDAFLAAGQVLGVDATVLDYAEHTLSVGTDALAASYVECEIALEDGETSVVWGVGIDSSIVTSSLKAIISAVNRSAR
ncbi:MAG: 2-isopropylmalate synthase, partial [Bifidobacterium castoris]|nr:2-isopropylmalate synthase [Bifidobacterium castoris]